MLSNRTSRSCSTTAPGCLNALFGARCFLTGNKEDQIFEYSGLNAPYGARCYLTRTDPQATNTQLSGLNAPYEALHN
ncbi:hypothetical protein CYJ22_10015 [Schaalia odontolytica]|uniref:Uncharacterized protein n=1 Tax=Schaalia odontolytica TaxID=1660 RepID=A0A2I1HXQ5_9ACTO|nr:hypothetical protein CYJ22_10015 [Schaalia odontolytica]